jgi:hypothetical protein
VGLRVNSDSVEEETVVQIHGSLFWLGFWILGLFLSLDGLRVSSSSQGVVHKIPWY